MLTPRVLLKHWFLLHSVTAHSAIKCALLPLLPLPDTEHPEILSSSPAKRRWSVKLELLLGRQSGGRPSYSTPSTLSSDRSQLKPFRSWQNLADRQIPTHTVELAEEVDIFLKFLSLTKIRDKVPNKVRLQASKETQCEIICLVDCRRSVR